MSYRQHLDELNEMQDNLPRNPRGDIITMAEPFNVGMKKVVSKADKAYCLIKINVVGAHGEGIVYVSDWSFENGLRTTQVMQQAKVYTRGQADHIIANEQDRSSMQRISGRMSTILVTYSDPVEEEDTAVAAWQLWTDVPEFDPEEFDMAMGHPSNFEAHRTALLTEPNQMFMVTNTTRAKLTLVVSFPGHITSEDYLAMRDGPKFGFNDVKVEYVGEGAASFSVFTFTL